MAWDSSSTITARRRANSTATTKATNLSTQQDIIPKSTHTADPALQPFLLSKPFDPAEYLNATLPALSTSGSVATRSSNDAIPLAELSTQTQTLLSHLSAHTTRLTNTLTQLTDEILRSGSRLAYEVEVLRGETIGLSEALTETLENDITKFVPDGLESYLVEKPKTSEGHGNARRRRSSTVSRISQPTTPRLPTTPRQPPQEEVIPVEQNDPEYIQKLRTLTLVRNRLETVIQTFGTAMTWTFPPSEVSVSSSFLSVSAPAPSTSSFSEPNQQSLEEKGQETSKKLRDEIIELLDTEGGIEKAREKVEELSELSRVWRGTVEEKGRAKFIEGLARLVEERENAKAQEGNGVEVLASRGVEEGRNLNGTNANANGDGRFGGGFDLFNRLQSLRGGAS